MTLQDDIARYARDHRWISNALAETIAASLGQEKIIIDRADLSPTGKGAVIMGTMSRKSDLSLLLQHQYGLSPENADEIAEADVAYAEKVKADAWDEGAREGDLAQYTGRETKPNPYRH